MSSSSSTSVVHIISSTTVHPASPTSAPPRWDLSVFDVAMLSIQYIQKGLLFSKPPAPLEYSLVIERLKKSLSFALVQFPPLAGRLADDPSTTTFVDCSDAGVLFVVASAVGLRVLDLINCEYGDVPEIVKSFFLLDGVPSYGGHDQPLLAVQVTELADAVFIGCSYNHAIGDGESFWHFFNSWSELCAAAGDQKPISRPPILDRPQLHPNIYAIQFQVKEIDIEVYKPPLLRECIFHFAKQTIVRLKSKANCKVSSLQALTGLMWRLITRSRRIPADQPTMCRMAVGVRKWMNPRLSRDCLGNYIDALTTSTKAGLLLDNDFSWVARTLHEMVDRQTSHKALEFMEEMVKRPRIYKHSMFDPGSIMVGSSPRFEMYGSDFGWGKGLAVLSGSSNKFDGKISAYPGRDEEGSVDFEVCLYPHHMEALLVDEEFLDAIRT